MRNFEDLMKEFKPIGKLENIPVKLYCDIMSVSTNTGRRDLEELS